MSGSDDRWVVLGLAGPRAAWFSEVARWATSGIVPVEFVKCLGSDEAVARLRSGRPWSALLVDADLAAADGELAAEATRAGCPTIPVVGDVSPATRSRGPRRPEAGSATLTEPFDRGALLGVLGRHARRVGAIDAPEPAPALPSGPGTGWQGDLVAVTGAPGSGCSTVAMAVAHHLARDPRRPGGLALVDLALHADQAVLHDAGEVVPGVQELVEAHRGAAPTAATVRGMLFRARERHYDLLLGLRRHEDWAALRPRAVHAAISGLRRSYQTVVADCDGDLEGEAECGSPEVEERNGLARAALDAATVVLAVGRAGVQGTHRLARTLRSLANHVEPARVQVVVNAAPGRRRDRAAVVTALDRLTVDGAHPPSSPVFVPWHPKLERTLRDGLPAPAAIGRPAGRAVLAALDRLEAPSGAARATRIAPGSLGTLAVDAEEAV